MRDNGPEPGGMMRYGIPAYRLPRHVLDAEISRLVDLGVRFEQNHRVTDLEAEQAEGGFDAVFVAVGAHLSKRVDIPNMDAKRVLDAVTFLRGVETGEQEPLSGTVAVYGGGNTAMDAARVARRVGADESVIVYRRTREQMPAHEEEAEDAEAEGIRINWLRTIKDMGEGDLTVEVQELDENGRPHGTGVYETLAADTVILALGQESDTAFLRGVADVEFDDDVVQVHPSTLMTGAPGIFAGGDAVPSQRTVTIGVGHGKRAARSIDAWLRSEEFVKAEARHHPLRPAQPLVLRRPRPAPAAGARPGHADQGLRGGCRRALRAGGALRGRTVPVLRQLLRVRRLLRVVPEDAIIKLGKGLRYEFDYAKCTGCGTCYRQCPVHAIELVAESEFDSGSRRQGPPTRWRGLTWTPRTFSPGNRPPGNRPPWNRSPSTGTRRRPTWPSGSTSSARSTRSRRPRRWPSWPTNGPRTGGPTSGGRCPPSSRCRARVARPARCTVPSRAVPWGRRSPHRRACS